MALFFYKEKNKDIRAAAYLRLSIEDGDKAESNSIGNQRELIRDFAAERPGLHLVEEYADDGYTGTNFERPGFKRMMEDLQVGNGLLCGAGLPVALCRLYHGGDFFLFCAGQLTLHGIFYRAGHGFSFCH